MFYIPIQTAYPDQTLRIELDGIAYDIRVYYSAYDDVIKEIIADGRDGKWYMEIVDGQSTGEINQDLALGLVNTKSIALVNGADLFEPYGHQELGSLFVIDGEGLNEIPDFDNMGDRYKILYVEKAQQEDFLISIGYKNASI